MNNGSQAGRTGKSLSVSDLKAKKSLISQRDGRKWEEF